MNRRLLVIDAEQDYLDIYQEILTHQGPMSSGNVALAPDSALSFDLTLAKSPEDGLKRLEQGLRVQRPMAAMILDLTTCGGKAMEIVRRAKSLDPQLLFVLTTAQTNPKMEEIDRLFGADFSDRWDFIAKPFSQWEMVQKAHHLVSDWDRREREREYIRQIQTQHESLLKTERFAAMGNLARSLGREFGNVIQKITTRAELALEKNEPSGMNAALKAIVTICENVAPIVRNLQTLAQTDARRENLSANLVLREMSALLQVEAKKSKVEISERLSASNPSVHGSRHELNQALLNLALNGIQAMAPLGGTLILETSENKQDVLFVIRDTGVGIPTEHLQKIFEPLFTTKAGAGTGLGVSATKRIVEAHGGTLTVSSQVGKGTAFTISLPRA